MKTKLLFLLSFVVFTPFLGVAADSQSGTNSITGVVRFSNTDPAILARLGPPGNEGMSQLLMVANSDFPDPRSATKFVPVTDPVTQAYDLTVSANNVPTIYRVYADLVLDGVNEEYISDTLLASPLTSNSAPAVLDFDLCVAMVELRYVDEAGDPVAVNDARVRVTETGTTRLRAQCSRQPAGLTGNFLIVPSDVEIDLAIEVEVGSDLYLDRLTHLENRVLTLACEEVSVLTITLPTTRLGRMTGEINLIGETEPATEGYLELRGRPVVRAIGPSRNQRYAAVDGETPGVDLSRPFTLEGLVPSTSSERWNVFAEMQFGTGYRFEYFRTPGLGEGQFNSGADVKAADTTDLGDTFVMTPARLVGRIVLSGPAEEPGSQSALRGLVRAADYDANTDGIPDAIGAAGIGGSYAILTGVDELAPGSTRSATGGSAAASFAGMFDPVTATFEGDYETVVGMLDDEPGVWRYDGLNLAIEHPGTNGAPYVSQTVYITEDNPWQGVLAPGERMVNNVNYGFAEVCVRIRSSAPFYYPRLDNGYGQLNGIDSRGALRSYHVSLGRASSPPYTADAAVFEAIVTCYLPEGSYSLRPAISIPNPDGGVSDTQLPVVEVSVVAGERYCVDECINLVIRGPFATSNFGFISYADAFSCEATLTNLSLRTHPLGHPEIRLGYSDIRILEPVGLPRTELHTAHGLFPGFDGGIFRDHPEYYSNMVITAEARDTRGRIVTRQILAHYDFTLPEIVCPGDIAAASPDGGAVPVEFSITATDNRPEGIYHLRCSPVSGSLFPVGTTPVKCQAVDFCYNTNTCSFNVIVEQPGCTLSISPEEVLGSPGVRLSWDCVGTLESAPAVEGPWSDLPAATSPHMLIIGDESKFFRVRRKP